MPRQADPRLEDRIVAAAYHLWSKGGEKALTMRAIARAADTTTPTVYDRFRDKRDIIHTLRSRAQANLLVAIRSSKTLPLFCRRYFDFAVGHPNEYDLLHTDWSQRYARGEFLPSFEFLKGLLASRLGGSPDQHLRPALALAALLHGAAMVLLTKGIDEDVSREIRQAATAAFESLVEAASSHRFQDKPIPARRSADPWI